MVPLRASVSNEGLRFHFGAPEFQKVPQATPPGLQLLLSHPPSRLSSQPILLGTRPLQGVIGRFGYLCDKNLPTVVAHAFQPSRGRPRGSL